MKKILSVMCAGLMSAMIVAPCFAKQIVITGSTTVLPIAQRAAEEFMKNNPSADISVRGGGSGVGIAALIDGTCDIADSSRPIKPEEIEKATANGNDPKANMIAMDGIAVLVNSANSVTALTKKQVKDIYTGAISDWSEVGGAPGKIVVVSRDTSSGTYEAFGELALDKKKPRPDALLQASSQAVASTVANTPGAIGYAGLAFITSSVKAVTIDGVTPTKDTVITKKFAYSRPLFMYTNGAPKGEVKDFLDFILSAEGQKMVDEEGFVGIK